MEQFSYANKSQQVKKINQYMSISMILFEALILLVVVPFGIGFPQGYLLGKLMKVAALVGSWCFPSYQAADNELCHTMISG